MHDVISAFAIILCFSELNKNFQSDNIEPYLKDETPCLSILVSDH